MTVKARTISRVISLTLLGVMVVAIAGLLPFHAFAALESNDLLGEDKQVEHQLMTLPKLIAFISYVIGTAFAVRSLFALRRHVESPDEHPLQRVIGFSAIAAMLIMLPYSMGLTQKTIGTGNEQGSQGNVSISSSFQVQPACATKGTIGAVFCNLVVQFSPFASFLDVIAYVMAAALTLTGLLNLKAYGDDPSQMPLRSIIVKFVLATMFISLPLTMQLFITSVTGVQSIETQVQINRPSSYSGTLR